MHPRALLLLILVVITGCATEPQTTPTSWAQKPEERGKLQVGKVVAIVRWRGAAAVTESTGAESARVLYGMFAPLAIVLAPAYLVACGAQGDGCDEPKKYGVSPDENGNIFRHVVRLAGIEKEVIKDEYWTFTVGDCVALRHKPDMLVAALPIECNSKDLREKP